jgi:hypothetical protein
LSLYDPPRGQWDEFRIEQKLAAVTLFGKMVSLFGAPNSLLSDRAANRPQPPSIAS